MPDNWTLMMSINYPLRDGWSVDVVWVKSDGTYRVQFVKPSTSTRVVVAFEFPKGVVPPNAVPGFDTLRAWEIVALRDAIEGNIKRIARTFVD